MYVLSDYDNTNGCTKLNNKLIPKQNYRSPLHWKIRLILFIYYYH